MQAPFVLTGVQPVIYVNLIDDKDQEKFLKPFYCPVCGHLVFQHFSRIRILIPGENEKKAPIVIQCRGKITITKHSQEPVDYCPTCEQAIIPNPRDGKIVSSVCKTRFYIS